MQTIQTSSIIDHPLFLMMAAITVIVLIVGLLAAEVFIKRSKKNNGKIRP